MTDQAPHITVFYDGSCPLCRREIAIYQRLTPVRRIKWWDVSTKAPDQLALGLSQCDAMKRFHVLDEKGRLHNGACAFAVLWQHYPGFCHLGKIISWPGFRHLAELVYRGFLIMRPIVQKMLKN